jgi:hypothetical protein
MLIEPPVSSRPAKHEVISTDLAIVGAGMAGLCCAIEAARAGLQVTLVHDRPVPGGNASSEVRLWLLGATVHMGSNNRWAREGGVVNEVMLENLWRNQDGNPVIFDAIVLDKIRAEKNLRLLLNTSCFEVSKDAGRITGLCAFNSQNSTMYEINAPLFCDASGDGIAGFLAGAAFRMGAEARDEFGEGFAPDEEFGYLLGSSLYFYSKNAGHPVKFVPPGFALADIEDKIPRHTHFNAGEDGCKLWWIEWGGRLDTIHDAEAIKWELWKVVYGVWNYIKNSGKFPEAENLTLEWIGTVPGKRESRRFEGDYILRQSDIIQRRQFPDAVAYGGWSIDLHPADGVFAKVAGSHHLHSKGVYQIPYRCYYSRNVDNLFLSGRIISASHVAHGTTRVMATCAAGAQAVAQAAVLCKQHGKLPREIGAEPQLLRHLQRRLGRTGHYIPAVNVPDPDNLVTRAKLGVSSKLALNQLPPDGPELALDRQYAQMLPLTAGPVPELTLHAAVVEQDTALTAELRTTSDPWHFCPDVLLEQTTVDVKAGRQARIPLRFNAAMPRDGYLFVCLSPNPLIQLQTSELRVSGLLRLQFKGREDYSKIGGENYDTFVPERRPGGHNLAMDIQPAIDLFGPENLSNGWQRPTCLPNAWVADPKDHEPRLSIQWSTRQQLSRISLFFDGDFDHALETVHRPHPERAVIFCVKKYAVTDSNGNVVVSVDDNHQSTVHHDFDTPLETGELTLKILETWGAPAAMFEVRCYGPAVSG